MKDEIEREIEIVQNLITNLGEDNAVQIKIYTPDGKCLDYYWNNNIFLKSAIQAELRNLKLELLEI
jgi:hypothetical protein